MTDAAADGVLTQNLDAWVKAQTVWADAVSKYKGNWVPAVQSGPTGGGNGGMDLIQLLTAKAAKDLALDMSVPQTAAAQ